jgi:hypothetical protein
MSEEEIEAEIAASRRERKAREAARRRELEALGEHLADQAEAKDVKAVPVASLPPLMELQRLRYQRAHEGKQAEHTATRAQEQGIS